MSQIAPVCFPCARAMRCAENSYSVRDARTATSAATVWSGDRFECPDCNASIIVGFGRGWEEDPDAPSNALEFRR